MCVCVCGGEASSSTLVLDLKDSRQKEAQPILSPLFSLFLFKSTIGYMHGFN